MILALAGGVGGARLAVGLARALPAEQLCVGVNVGDDFEHLGLHVSPDLDTVMYSLAGLNNAVTGWGRADETWSCMAELERLGGPTWFRLGDRDLAVHLERTRRLSGGETLSAVTADFCRRLGIDHRICPVSDQRVRTIVLTESGALDFQEYFVRLHCKPAVLGLRYDGAENASLASQLASLTAKDALHGVVLCPSNPWLSIGPMLAVQPLRELLERAGVPVVGVSPIVAGDAVKGPAAKIMRELGEEVSVVGVANYYGDLVSGWVIDSRDAALERTLMAAGRAVAVTDTIMDSLDKTVHVARVALALLDRLRDG